MRTTIASALLSLAAILAAGEGFAQNKKDAPAAGKSDEASKHFKSGVAFYKDHDFSAALVEFKLAYELLPNYNVLYNLGQTARELKDHAAALTAYERYLREGGSKVAPARVKEVQAAIEELRKKVGRLKVSANVEGAEISIDDVAVGKAPLAEPVVVNVGRRRLSATSSGYTPAQRAVDVGGSAEMEVSLELIKIGAATAPSVDEPPPKPSIPVVAWVSLAATGAGVIATGVTGGLAISARSALKEELAKFPGSKQGIADAQSRTRTLSVTTDVLLGVTAAGAAATTVLFVLATRAPEKTKPAEEKADKADKPDKPAARLYVSPTGVGVFGVF